MDNNEQMHEEDEYDYNREPPLDQATISKNRSRSKYVFMTLCFLLSMMLFYTYLKDGSDWFPLVGGIVLAVLGIVFLRSPDNPPGSPGVERSEDEEKARPQVLSPFEELVQEALTAIPDEFHEKMQSVSIHVVYEPDAEVLARMKVQEGQALFGLYEGVPLTSYGHAQPPYPEVITIYQRSIEDYCRHNPTRIREQVRATVLHEVAHHFGMGHEEMPIWLT